MSVIASTGQADEGTKQLLTVAYQFGGLLDDTALSCNQTGTALVEHDLENSRHVANFLPRSLEVKLTWERLLTEEEAAVYHLYVRNMSAESAVRGNVLI